MQPTDSALLFADMPTAQARTALMATRLGCDGVGTKYWYYLIQLTNGQVAMIVNQSGPFDSSPGPTALSQLTPIEIAALVPSSTISSLIPTEIFV
jgi:hypothetical protein